MGSRGSCTQPQVTKIKESTQGSPSRRKKWDYVNDHSSSSPRNPPCALQTSTCRLNCRIMIYVDTPLWHRYIQNTEEFTVKASLMIVFSALLDMKLLTSVSFHTFCSNSSTFKQKKRACPSLQAYSDGLVPFLSPSTCFQLNKARRSKHMSPVLSRKHTATKATHCSRWKQGSSKNSSALWGCLDLGMPICPWCHLETQLWKAAF